MRKRFILLSLLITLLFVSLYVTIFNNDKYKKQYKYIDAYIYNIDKNYVDIITDNYELYTLKINDFKFAEGDMVNIKYSGKFDYFNIIQNIDILNVNTSNKSENNIDKIIESMSLDEKIGQLLLVRVPEKNKLDPIKNYNIGGYILFNRDIDNKSKLQLQMDIANFQINAKIPLLIAIDEEGGTVTRLSSNKKIVKNKFLSPQELFKIGGVEKIRTDAITKRNLLEELGFNINLAPVADVSLDINSYIYPRTFGGDYKETAEYIKTVLSTQNKNVSYVLKHFPGYADNLNTHIGISVDNRECESIFNDDFLPFKSGIDNGAMAIMMSHNITTCIDDMPSSISRKMHNILRSKLNFKGIIMTDDLTMAGINNYSSNNIYVDAIKAGNNLLIVNDYEKAFKQIKNAILTDELNEKLIDVLVKLVIEFKVNKNLISIDNIGFYS